MDECVVCHKPRFLIEGVPSWFFPLVCSHACYKEMGHFFDEGANGSRMWVQHIPTDGVTVPVWSFGEESPEAD